MSEEDDSKLPDLYMYCVEVARKQKALNNYYDYKEMQKACKALDEEDDLKQPILKWFWPNSEAAFEEENAVKNEDSSDSDSNSEELVNSDDWLNWKKSSGILTADEIGRRISHIVMYLREKYNYCLWCGVKFDDEKDMLEVCPGRTRAEHEGDNVQTNE